MKTQADWNKIRFATEPDLNEWVSLGLFSAVLIIVGYMMFAYTTGRFEQHKSWVYSVDVDQAGLIASASDNQILLWKGIRCIYRLTGHTGTLKSVVFSHDGTMLASCSIDKTIRLWSVADKKTIKILRAHTSGVNKVAFSVSDQYLISAGYDHKLLIWNWRKNSVLRYLDISQAEFSINRLGILAYVDSSCRLKLFDLHSFTEIATMGNDCGIPLFHPYKDQIAIKLKNGIFHFIETKNGKIQSDLKAMPDHYGGDVESFKFTPNGKYLITSIWGGDIIVWDWEHKKMIRKFHGSPLHAVHDLAFNQKDELLSASGDRSIKIWDWKTGVLKTDLGDGVLQAKFKALLSILVLFTLMSGFSCVMNTSQNAYSSLAIILILSAYSYGLFFVLYFVRRYLVPFAIILSWMATTFSLLMLISIYGSGYMIVSIPIALFFAFVYVKESQQKEKAYRLILLNLMFYGYLCYLMLLQALEW